MWEVKILFSPQNVCFTPLAVPNRWGGIRKHIPAILLKPRIVDAPQAVDPISLMNDSLNHLWFVVREVIRDIKHDIADQTPDRWYRLWGNILKTELILGWIPIFWRWIWLQTAAFFQFQGRSPIDWQHHDGPQILAQPRCDIVRVKFHVDLSAERVDSVGKVEALHTFGKLLTNAVDDKDQICGLRPFVCALTSRA